MSVRASGGSSLRVVALVFLLAVCCALASGAVSASYLLVFAFTRNKDLAYVASLFASLALLAAAFGYISRTSEACLLSCPYSASRRTGKEMLERYRVMGLRDLMVIILGSSGVAAILMSLWIAEYLPVYLATFLVSLPAALVARKKLES